MGEGMEAGVGCGSTRGRRWIFSAVCQATGDRNKLIMIWDTATCKRLHIFTGHRDAVSVSEGHQPPCLQGRVVVFFLAPLTAVSMSVHLSVGPVLPEGHAPAVQCLPRPLCKGLECGGKCLCRDAVRPGLEPH